MKSLEIVNEYINEIKNSKVERDDGLTQFAVLHLEELEQIKQDLEVLEIIKNKRVEVHILITVLSGEKTDKDALFWYNFFVEKDMKLTLEELLKIKQWLEENENETVL